MIEPPDLQGVCQSRNGSLNSSQLTGRLSMNFYKLITASEIAKPDCSDGFSPYVNIHTTVPAKSKLACNRCCYCFFPTHSPGSNKCSASECSAELNCLAGWLKVVFFLHGLLPNSRFGYLSTSYVDVDVEWVDDF